MLQTSAVINVTQGMDDLYVVTSHVNYKNDLHSGCVVTGSYYLGNLSKKL